MKNDKTDGQKNMLIIPEMTLANVQAADKPNSLYGTELTILGTNIPIPINAPYDKLHKAEEDE